MVLFQVLQYCSVYMVVVNHIVSEFTPQIYNKHQNKPKLTLNHLFLNKNFFFSSISFLETLDCCWQRHCFNAHPTAHCGLLYLPVINNSLVVVIHQWRITIDPCYIKQNHHNLVVMVDWVLMMSSEKRWYILEVYMGFLFVGCIYNYIQGVIAFIH